MNFDYIAEVGLDEKGRLYVRPATKDFSQIWRAMMEVNWQPEKRRLRSPVPREWSLARWYQQILAAAADEYGTALVLDQGTAWTNVAPEVRREIEALPPP